MHETADDLQTMQAVLDRSYARAGAHLVEIHSGRVRLTATEVAERWEGMRVAVVATTTRDGRPITGPVDAFLYRGAVLFGTSPSAVRSVHLEARPAVSATWVDGEKTVVTVHGRARTADLVGIDRGFADVARAQYGDDWDDWGMDGIYYVIEADLMFAADMARHHAT